MSLSQHESPDTARPKRVVGRYAIFDEIAAGGMASVFFGRLVGPLGFARTVAIKRLHPQFARDREFVAGFLDEARLAARIQHPNVVQTLDVVTEGDDVLLVMEYVEAETLSTLFKRAAALQRGVPVPVAVGILIGVLEGLHAAHEAKSSDGRPLTLVHRDVSPQNIMIGRDGIPRVLDFGIAKAATRSEHTKDGKIKGKLSYMSPEQLSGKPLDRRTDVFAAAVVLWELLTRTRLFNGSDPGEVVTKVLTERIAAPSELNGAVPPELDRVVLAALSRSASSRIASAREFAAALEQAVSPASTRLVGEWVDELAGGSLDSRNMQVAALERSMADLESSSAESSRAHLDSLIDGVAGAAQPLGGQDETQAVVAPEPAAQPRPARPWRVVAAVFSVLLLAGAAFGAVTLTRSGTVDVAAAPPAAPRTTALERATHPAAALPEEPAAAVSAAQQPPPATSASAPALVVEKAPPAVKPVERRPSRSRSRRDKVDPPKAAKKLSCNPPYVIDGNGIKVPRPECH